MKRFIIQINRCDLECGSGKSTTYKWKDTCTTNIFK